MRRTFSRHSSWSRRSRWPFDPWLIAIAVVVPTFMEVLDTTIANVALRYMAGSLSAVGPKFVSLTPDEKQRVLNYLATYVFVSPPDEPWEPYQTVMIVESAMGKRIATVTEDGPKLSE